MDDSAQFDLCLRKYHSSANISGMNKTSSVSPCLREHGIEQTSYNKGCMFGGDRSFGTAVERCVDCKVRELRFNGLQSTGSCDQRDPRDGLSMPTRQGCVIPSEESTDIPQIGTDLCPLVATLSVYRHWIPVYIGNVHGFVESI